MAITTRNTHDIAAPSSGESLDGAGADSRAANDNRIEKHSLVESDSARRRTSAYRRAKQPGSNQMMIGRTGSRRSAKPTLSMNLIFERDWLLS
jgi:hypothetical protein